MRQSPQGLDAIVVAGGDGTFARAIGTALAFGVPIGLVPLGTFNDLARTLAIPLDVEGACAVIAGGRPRTIDVARVNGAYYVTEASIGVSSRLTRLQKTRDKQRFGLLAVLRRARLRAVRYLRPFYAEIAYDGSEVRLSTVQLTVANSNHFGGFITVADAAIDDGWLDLYSVEIEDSRERLGSSARLLSGKRRVARKRAHASLHRLQRRHDAPAAHHRRRGARRDDSGAIRDPAQALRVFVPGGRRRISKRVRGENFRRRRAYIRSKTGINVLARSASMSLYQFRTISARRRASTLARSRRADSDRSEGRRDALGAGRASRRGLCQERAARTHLARGLRRRSESRAEHLRFAKDAARALERRSDRDDSAARLSLHRAGTAAARTSRGRSRPRAGTAAARRPRYRGSR